MNKLSFNALSWQIRKLIVYRHETFDYAMGIIMSKTGDTYTVKRLDTAGSSQALADIMEVELHAEESYVDFLYTKYPPEYGTDSVKETDIIKEYPLPTIFEKYASDVYFDSSPAQDIPPENLNFTNPIDDKQLRRTNPKRYDKRQDWYSEAPDSDLVNKYDNAIQGESSLKLGWQIYHDFGTPNAMRVLHKLEELSKENVSDDDILDDDNDYGKYGHVYEVHNDAQLDLINRYLPPEDAGQVLDDNYYKDFAKHYIAEIDMPGGYSYQLVGETTTGDVVIIAPLFFTEAQLNQFLSIRNNASQKLSWAQKAFNSYSYEDLLREIGPNQVWEALSESFPSSMQGHKFLHTGPNFELTDVPLTWRPGVTANHGRWHISDTLPDTGWYESKWYESIGIAKDYEPYKLIKELGKTPTESSLDWEIENVISYGAFDGYDLVGKLIQKTSDQNISKVLSFRDFPQKVRTFIKDYYHNELEEFPELVAHLNSLRVYGAERPRFYEENVGAEYFDNENLILSYIPLEDLFSKYSRGLVHEIDHVVQYYLKSLNKLATVPTTNDPKYYNDNKFYLNDKAEIRARGVELAFEKKSWKIHADDVLEKCNAILHSQGRWLDHEYVDYKEISFDDAYKLLVNDHGQEYTPRFGFDRNGRFFVLKRIYKQQGYSRNVWDLYVQHDGEFDELDSGIFQQDDIEGWISRNTASLKFSWKIHKDPQVGDKVKIIADEKLLMHIGISPGRGIAPFVTGTITDIGSSIYIKFYGSDYSYSFPRPQWLDYFEIVSSKMSSLYDKNEKLFNERYQNYGEDGGNLFWSDTVSQYARFKLLSQVGDMAKASVLDVGTGFGDFLDYAQEYALKIGLYVGVDIIPAIIEVAERKHPYDRFEVRDVTKVPFGDNAFDFVIGSGLFALEDEQWTQSVVGMLNAMYKMAKKGIAVNFLKGNILSDNFRTTTEKEVLDIAHKITDKVKVVSKISDDITLYMYK